MNTIDVRSLFSRARQLYSKDKIYISSKTINGAGIHPGIFPVRKEYGFSIYNFGDSEDIEKLRTYARQGIVKSYGCDICPISEYDNIATLSREKNQLWIDDESPSLSINEPILINTRRYRISGTVPQYYYNHLLFSSENHMPTYNLFMSDVFIDLLSFLQEQSQREPEIKAFFNGNSGSNTHHFHVHLTNQTIAIMNNFVNSPLQTTTDHSSFVYREGPVKTKVYTGTDPSILRTMILEDCYYFIRNKDYDGDLQRIFLTANFQYKNNKFWISIQLCNKERQYFSIGNDNFFVFPFSFTCSFDRVQNDTILNLDVNKGDEINTNISKFYLDPENNVITSRVLKKSTITDITNDIQTFKTVNLNKNTLLSDIELIIERIPSEFLQYITVEQNYDSYQHIINSLSPLLGNCFELNIKKTFEKTIVQCSSVKFNNLLRLISYIFNTVPDINLLTPYVLEQLLKLKILMEQYDITRYNNVSRLESGYLYFRGNFLQNLISKTFHNLLLISNEGQTNSLLSSYQSKLINEWLDFQYKRIGEVSAYGTNTASKIKHLNPDIDIDMILKITTGASSTYFLNEFFNGTSINNIRKIIPNFVTTYGAFNCLTSRFDKLCDGNGNEHSYVILENIRDSNTVVRTLKTPVIYNDQIQKDILDMIYQITVSLAFGQKINDFTHNDLHCDNILEFNFIENKNFLNLLSIYHQVPKIDDVYFRYYMDQNNVFIVPVKKLYVIIDYGGSYTDDRVDEKSQPYRVPDTRDSFSYDKYGTSANRSNSFIDMYIFSIHLFFSIFVYKPYLLIDIDENDVMEILDNDLNKYFKKFFKSYRKVFSLKYKDIYSQMGILVRDQGDIGMFRKTLYNCIKKEYRNEGNNPFPWYFVHHKSDPDDVNSSAFTESDLPEDFRGSLAVATWIRDNLYNTINYKHDSYFFDWGFIEYKHLGIEPPVRVLKELEQLIEDKFEKKELLKNSMNVQLLAAMVSPP